MNNGNIPANALPIDSAAGYLPPGPTVSSADWSEIELNQTSSLIEFQKKFGWVFTLFLEGHPPRVYVAEPETIHEIFIGHQQDLEAKGTSVFAAMTTKESVLSLNGERHRIERRNLSRGLDKCDSPSQVKSIIDIVAEADSELSVGTSVPLTDFTDKITRRVILSLTFGQLPHSRVTALLGAVGGAIEYLRSRQLATLDGLTTSAERGFKLIDQNLNEEILTEIAVSRLRPWSEKRTILDRLIEIRELSNSDILIHLKTILSAGHETTSASLAWALCYLTENQKLVQRIRKEFKDLASPLDSNCWLNFPFLNALCLEALRRGSPVPSGNARVVKNSFRAAGFSFPEGVELVPCIFLANRHPNAFPEPELFDPERFYHNTFSAHTFMPFGIGSRRCPGSALALQELKIVIAYMITQSDLQVSLPSVAFPPICIGPTIRPPREVTISHTLTPLSTGMQ